MPGPSSGVVNRAASIVDTDGRNAFCGSGRAGTGLEMGANTLRIGLVAFTVLAVAAIINMVMLQPTNGRRAAAKPSRAVTPSEVRPDAATMRAGERAPAAPVEKSEPKPEGPQAAAAPATSTQDVTRAIQRELKERGYEAGAADGQPGLMTRAAIMAYEHDRNMTLTGEPTPQLLKQILLNIHPVAAALRAPESQEQSMQATQVIRTVQQSLVTLGYLPGKVDGRMGDDTVRAIREFELDQGLHETGRVSGQLVARLSRLAGQGRLGSAR